MNMEKSKAMFLRFADKKNIIVEAKQIQHLNEYIYLGMLT